MVDATLAAAVTLAGIAAVSLALGLKAGTK